MSKSLTKLSKGKKIVASKVLDEEGYNYEEIGRVLNISGDSAKRYISICAEIGTPEKLRTFEETFRVMVRSKNFQGQMSVLDRILELIPKERRISELVKAGEYFQGKTRDAVNVQVNNFVPLLGGDSLKNVPKDDSDREVVTTK